MKAKIVPAQEREVVITMTESEARDLRKFIGGSCKYNRVNICYHDYEDDTLCCIYENLKKILDS